jgi:hypothetical protein
MVFPMQLFWSLILEGRSRKLFDEKENREILHSSHELISPVSFFPQKKVEMSVTRWMTQDTFWFVRMHAQT